MSDYMKEAERLADEYAKAVHDGRDRDCQQTRAALLAHIQRGAVPEGWREDVYLAAQMLTWADDDGGLTDQQDRAIRAHQKKMFAMLAAAAAVPAPAEVPMPKPVAYGFGNTAITGHTNRLMMVRIDIPGGDQYAGAFWLPLVLADEAHTYGVACRAAGEAAGYARGLRDAVRDADIEALRLYVRALCKAVDAATDFAGTVAGGASWWDDVWADHAAALDRARERISQAALRGEVKP